ncbi:hypothetical protein PHYPSEUDO_009539 [Phytophthora pseudosyringae]|uniref:Uncharacterized protein n=1 Tax=Phytophthora pseudosyringae TaxID=221518 RepID=A0A8T1WJC5_9STRA|nr:hypothetical protein PHYPSEUDO_009539 [Phytophthora pseudosyringae]
MPKRKARSPYHSALSDNVRPGAPTTMDVLIRWLTTPGNVKRWRTEARSPLVRELVDMMQDEGLAHRKAPFVRYKVDATEKQYIQAKQWLLETGMHDAYMTGKASKDVRAQVDRVCPQFKRLDPAFRGVPFSKKHPETIELDEDSAEDVEQEEEEEEEEEESEEEEEEEEKAAAPTEKRNTFRARLFADKDKDSTTTETQSKKAQTFRERLFAGKDNAAEKEKEAPPSTESQQKGGGTFRERRLAGNDGVGQEKPSAPVKPRKKASRLAKQIEPSPGYAAARKSLTTEELQEMTNTPREQMLSSANTGAEKEKSSTTVEPKKNKSMPRDKILSSALQVAMEQAAPKTAEAPAKKRRGRPPKSAATVPLATTNGTEETSQAVKRNKENALKTAQKTNGTKDAAPKQPTTKRKNSEEEPSAVKRTRSQEQNDTGIEREALLKRVNDEEKQRHEMYQLERAKLECELESKQVQLLFEKAAARKKLDLLGVSQEEIDRILPL